jgi:chromate transporter
LLPVWQEHCASVGIFLPVYPFTVVPAPGFKRHRDNPQLKAFVDGATAAATGAITGAVIALVSLAIPWSFKLSEPILVTASALSV